MSRVPRVYRLPTGGPLRWQDDETGETQAAVNAYFEHHKSGIPMSAEHIEIVRDYLQYYTEAPCWYPGTTDALRESVKTIATEQCLDAWLDEALEIGIDPF